MMHSCRNPFHCFVPPHVLDQLANSPDPQVRNIAKDGISASAAARSTREVLRTLPIMAAIPSPAGRKHRLVYDMQQREFGLPGTLVRTEGQDPVEDTAANEAYDFAGVTYDFYQQIFHRNSLDDNGMTLISSVHYGEKIPNAFWNGEQMLYGDGDGQIFLSFTRSLEVVAHELTHGVIMFESNLIYRDEPGALNEHFADSLSAVAEQWHRGQDVTEASWLMGDELIGPTIGVKAIRTFKEGPAYENHPLLGTDPQRKRMRDKYTGPRDNGGVHLNSGIPNHAFYRTAMALGGNSWDKVGPIWYETLRALTRTSSFQDCAVMTYLVAGRMFGQGSREQQAVIEGWHAVEIEIGPGV